MAFLLKYLPFILQSIFAVQAAIPTLKGETKKQIATTMVTLAAGVVGAAPDAHVAAIGGVIDGLIPALQATGLLAKDQVPTVIPPVAGGQQ